MTFVETEAAVVRTRCNQSRGIRGRNGGAEGRRSAFEVTGRSLGGSLVGRRRRSVGLPSISGFVSQKKTLDDVRRRGPYDNRIRDG